jgi:starch synthase (maltosyl-transferring)
MQDGRKRAVIENVQPMVDGGRFPAKRAVGEKAKVSADVFVDGHDRLSVRLHYRHNYGPWRTVPMQAKVNDRFEGAFVVEEVGSCQFAVEAMADQFRTWLEGLVKKRRAGKDTAAELADGASLVARTAARAEGAEAGALDHFAARLGGEDAADALDAALDDQLSQLMDRWQSRELATLQDPPAVIQADPDLALFSAWYEIFPRSVPGLSGEDRHGTFKDLEVILPEIKAMGFDVVYLPPIHPIGTTHRKGRNNVPECEPGDVGSPWAIGSLEGGHKDVHPELGSMEDFERLTARARELGLEIALDIAFQCSPDHPWVSEHPEWFRHRVDGSIRYAENPPKEYQDIYPLDFETEDWRALWKALRDVFLHWIRLGVRVFRVDNPHTKPFGFWEWCLGEIKRDHPGTIFLSEAFTRPKPMHRLAKAGFNQSYTYFTWRNTKWEIESYMTQLVEEAPRDFYRPNFWPNTPDILPEFLQYSGRPGFLIRLVLAATLSASYGVYGPAFELCEDEAPPGREEYKDSEKFQLKIRDWSKPGNIREHMTLVNEIRRANPALQTTWNLRFVPTDNDFVIAYLKHSDDEENLVLTVVCLDPYNPQAAWVQLPDDVLEPGRPFMVHDLLGDERYIWQGLSNYLRLDPEVLPARIFQVHRRLKRETDFDYFL